MPRLVQWSRFSDAFGRLFGLQGTTQLNVVDDCFLTLQVEEELLHLAELRGWRAFGGSRFSIGVVGNNSHVALTNPLSSGRLVVVEGFTIDTLAAARFRVGFRVNAGYTAGFQARDTRSFTSNGDNLGPGIQVAATPGFAINGNPTAEFNVVTGFPTALIPMQHVLTPGWDLLIECATVNIGIFAGFYGKAREFTQLER